MVRSMSNQDRSTYLPMSAARELADVVDLVVDRAREPYFNPQIQPTEEVVTMNSINRGWQAGPGTPASMPATGPDVGLEHVSPQTAEKIRRQRQAEGLRNRAEDVAAHRPAAPPSPTVTPETASREAAASKVSAATSTAGASTSKVPEAPAPLPGAPVVGPAGQVTVSSSDWQALMRAADAQLKAADRDERRRDDLRSGRQSFSLDRIRGHRAAARSVTTKMMGRNRR